MASNVKMILFGVCINNDDPLLAGRIRAVTDNDYSGNQPQEYDIGVCQKISQEIKISILEQKMCFGVRMTHTSPLLYYLIILM